METAWVIERGLPLLPSLDPKFAPSVPLPRVCFQDGFEIINHVHSNRICPVTGQILATAEQILDRYLQLWSQTRAVPPEIHKPLLCTIEWGVCAQPVVKCLRAGLDPWSSGIPTVCDDICVAHLTLARRLLRSRNDAWWLTDGSCRQRLKLATPVSTGHCEGESEIRSPLQLVLIATDSYCSQAGMRAKLYSSHCEQAPL